MVVAVMLAVVIPVVATLAVPAMIVVEAPPVAFPIALVVAFPVMAGLHPVCARIRRPAPIAVVPSVVIPIGVPVAPNPQVVRTRTLRLNPHHTRLWRSANSDPEGDLGEDSACRQQH